MKSTFHMTQPAHFHRRYGFTLIEVIATLTLSAVLMALMLPLIGSGLEGSRRAKMRLPEAHSLRTEMDAIWHYYRTTDPTDLPALSVALAEAAEADPPPPYTLISNDWVDFNPGGHEFTPPSGTHNCLRVTLGNSQGERLTAYFFPIP
ncbi:MAG: type II secretion system protein [Verrucomicrobiaceae bacterium]